MSECEVCGAKAETDVCFHDVCMCCYDVIADMVDRMFRDPAAVRAIRATVDVWAKDVRR
jgi:hypothetical protein